MHMSKFLIRDDYYQMILEIIELERISIGDYLEHKFNEYNNANPHFVDILYKDINVVLEGILNEGEGDIAIANGDFVVENGDIKLTGPINNLHLMQIGLHMKLVDKLSHSFKDVNDLMFKLEKFEDEYLVIDNNTPEYNRKLKELNQRIKGWQKPNLSEKIKQNKTRLKIPKENKVRAELQQEINSICPFCESGEVGHFEIHHIDENPSNNEFTNLILLCRTCHSKITKGDIKSEEVKFKKENLKMKIAGVEFVSAVIDSLNCDWKGKDKPNVFFSTSPNNSSLPIIGFTLINHSAKTVVLKTVHLNITRLQSGIHGLPQATALKSIIKYQLCIDDNIHHLLEPLQLPSNNAAKFDIELYEKIIEDEIVPPQGRMVLSFTFEFNNDISTVIPDIFLNCTSKNDPLRIYRLV